MSGLVPTDCPTNSLLKRPLRPAFHFRTRLIIMMVFVPTQLGLLFLAAGNRCREIQPRTPKVVVVHRRSDELGVAQLGHISARYRDEA